MKAQEFFANVGGITKIISVACLILNYGFSEGAYKTELITYMFEGVKMKKKEFEILKNHLEKKIRAIKKDSTEAFQEYNIKNELIEKLQKENVNLKIQLLKNNATFLKKHLEIVSCENFSIMNKQRKKFGESDK